MSDRTHRYFINMAHFVVHYLLLIFPTAALAIQKDWQSTYSDILALGTGTLVIFGLATLPVGWLGDRMSRNKLMAVFFIGGGASAILAGFATGPVFLAGSLSAIGLFAAIYHPVGLAMISDLAPQQGRALAANGVFGNLGLSGAAIATGFLADTLGWHMAFVLPGLVIFAVGVIYTVLFWNSCAASSDNIVEKTFQPVSRSAQLRIVVLVAFSALFGGLIFNGITMSLPKIMEERLADQGLPLHVIGTTSALVFAIAAFAQLPVGRALDRFGAKPVLFVLLGIQASALFLLANAQGPEMLALAIVLVTAIFAEIPVTSWLLARFVAPQWRARAYSFEYVFSLGVSSIIIPIVSRLHADGGGFRAMFLLLAGAAITVLLAALFLPFTGQKSAVATKT